MARLRPDTDARALRDGWAEVVRAFLAVARSAGLTPTQTQRLIQIARGLTYRQIADANTVSINTVRTEAMQLLQRLGVTCSHGIRDAAWAALARRGDGASREALVRFLHSRFE
jgi:DNA-binding CsgD family transcriptional regulator